MKRKKILFTGGGTGGHVTPNLAISQSIQKVYPEAMFYYVGKKGKAEESMVPKGWKNLFSESRASLHFVSTTSGSIKNPKVLLTLFLGFLQAVILLMRHRPHVIIASGGYVSAPILFAAGLLRKIRFISSKIMLHEANAEVGKMIQMAIRFADIVAYSFPGTKIDKTKKRFVGYPVRESIVQKSLEIKGQSKDAAREKLGIPANAKFILAFGGSQGARTINRGIIEALPILLADPDVHIMHGTGKKLVGAAYDGYQDVQQRLAQKKESLPSDFDKRYTYKDFMDNIGDYYAAADLVVCRGGAGSLVEVCANGIAAVCIPKADLAGDHQAVNARVLERLGAINIIFESKDPLDPASVENINATDFGNLVLSLLNDPEKRAEMGTIASKQYDPTTAQKCAQLVQYLLGDLLQEPELREETSLPEEAILGKGLLSIISMLHKKGADSLTPEQRRLALYKIDIAASQKSFVLPARACRMIGAGKFTERIDIVLNFALNKQKSPFTRRDAFVGLRHLGVINTEVVQTILEGCSDPYFETVNEALYALFSLLKENLVLDRFSHDRSITDESVSNIKAIDSMKSNIIARVKKLCSSSEFDIRMNALGVLSILMDDFPSINELLKQNFFHPNWQVRKKIVECYDILYQRNLVTLKEIQDILKNDFLQTSNGFDMDFLLKSEIKTIFQKESNRKFTDELRSIIFSSQTKKDKETRLITMEKTNSLLTTKEIVDQLLSYTPADFFTHRQESIQSSSMTEEEKEQELSRLLKYQTSHLEISKSK
ncbi:MAG: hypothetical protein CL916_00180 [Deltaproteobacteria bacterium]|nr:hypothetical protein [Deltaproteobacteria bacterium]